MKLSWRKACILFTLRSNISLKAEREFPYAKIRKYRLSRPHLPTPQKTW